MIKEFINKIFNKYPTAIPFGQGFDLTNLPVCTFKQGDKKFNFLLDTGASNNLINRDVLKDIEYSNVRKETDATLYGIDGKEQDVDVCRITISYKDTNFNDFFLIHDMTQAFDNVKKESGVTLHGILGSLFFHKYEYILDFSELIAYSKKG